MDVKNSNDLGYIKVPDKFHKKLKGFYACGSNYIPKKDFDSFINYLVKEYGENILLSYKTPISEDTDNVEIALRTFSNLSNSEKYLCETQDSINTA